MLFSSCLVIVVVSLLCFGTDGSLLVEGPTNTTARKGQTVSLTCFVDDYTDDEILWRRDRTYISLDRRIEIPDSESRFSVIGTEGNFTLRIENVRKTDGGKYECGYRTGGTTVFKLLEDAELTILTPPNPDSPQCSMQPSSGNQVGGSIDLTCSTIGGTPTPDITIHRRGHVLVSTNSAKTITHAYQLTAEDNGESFVCRMSTPALDNPRSCSLIPLSIPPTASIQPAAFTMKEGDSASFDCNGLGLPRIAEYNWTIKYVRNAEEVSPDYEVVGNGSSVHLKARFDAELTCTVRIPSGLSASTTAGLTVVPRPSTAVMTKQTTGATTTKDSDRDGSTSSSDNRWIIGVVAVALVFALAVLIGLGLCLRRRERKEQTNAPVEAREIDTIEGGGADVYAQVHKPKQENSTATPSSQAVNGTDIAASHTELDHATDGTDGRGKPPYTGHAMQDNPVYAKPDKTKNRATTESDDGVEDEESSPQADFGLVYADLDLASSPHASAQSKMPKQDCEVTLYATVVA